MGTISKLQRSVPGVVETGIKYDQLQRFSAVRTERSAPFILYLGHCWFAQKYDDCLVSQANREWVSYYMWRWNWDWSWCCCAFRGSGGDGEVLNLTFHWIQVQWSAYNMRPINFDQLTQSLQRPRRRRFNGRSRGRCRLDRVGLVGWGTWLVSTSTKGLLRSTGRAGDQEEGVNDPWSEDAAGPKWSQRGKHLEIERAFMILIKTSFFQIFRHCPIIFWRR